MARDAREATDQTNKIFVGGVSWNTEDAAFADFFSAYGEITDSVIMRTPEGKSRGFGFITFKDPEPVNKCMSETLELDGRTLDVKRAVPKEEQGRMKKTDQTRRTCKVFVGGLSPDTTKATMDRHFEKYGTITDSIVMTDRDTGRSRGFGFVTFDNEDSVESLMGEEHILDDKEVECKKAVPREESDEVRRRSATAGGSGGYGRGGYGGGGYDDRRRDYGGGYDRRPSYYDRGSRGNYGGGGGYDRGYDRSYDRGGYGGGGYDRGYDQGYGGRASYGDSRGGGGGGYNNDRSGYGGGGGGYGGNDKAGYGSSYGGDQQSGGSGYSGAAGGYSAGAGGYSGGAGGGAWGQQQGGQQQAAAAPASGGYYGGGAAAGGAGGYDQGDYGKTADQGGANYGYGNGGYDNAAPSYEQSYGAARGDASRGARQFHPYGRR